MTTLYEMMAGLPADRRRQIEKRGAEIIAEERHRFEPDVIGDTAQDEKPKFP